MRLALSSWNGWALSLAALAMLGSSVLGGCGDDGTASDGPFKSPYGDPGGDGVCGTGTYLVGATCVTPTLDAGIDSGLGKPDASADGGPFYDAVPDGNLFTESTP